MDEIIRRSMLPTLDPNDDNIIKMLLLKEKILNIIEGNKLRIEDIVDKAIFQYMCELN